jgi:hypothetical protein
MYIVYFVKYNNVSNHTFVCLFFTFSARFHLNLNAITFLFYVKNDKIRIFYGEST